MSMCSSRFRARRINDRFAGPPAKSTNLRVVQQGALPCRLRCPNAPLSNNRTQGKK
jgi:hypothetical protein